MVARRRTEEETKTAEAEGSFVASRGVAPHAGGARTGRVQVLWLTMGLTLVILILVAGALYSMGVFARLSIVPPTVVLEDSRTKEQTILGFGDQPLFRQSNFFAEVKEGFIEHKTTFLEANLSDMQVRFYRDGVLEKEVPILTKGKEGSWWETPAGLYEIQSKSENHFSSFGQVYQPWSMAFQGNFFIHGWPYYPDGTPVASLYSGGCIRLSDADAQALYALVSVRMPVLVYEDDYASDGFAYTTNVPQVTAAEYAVFDVQSGDILSQVHSEVVRPIASVTKLVTALTAAEYINLDNDITIDARAMVPTSVPRLTVGESLSAYSLLFPLGN